ncbi:MAG: hypothetical protein ACRC6M_05510, partial [Microcystaceae cyanobacterium]
IAEFKLLNQYILVEKTNSKKPVNSPFFQIWHHLIGDNFPEVNLKLQNIKQYFDDLSMPETIEILITNINYITTNNKP